MNDKVSGTLYDEVGGGGMEGVWLPPKIFEMISAGASSITPVSTTNDQPASAFTFSAILETEMVVLDILTVFCSFAPSMSPIPAQHGQVSAKLEARCPEQMPTRCRNIHR
jgi:hypothetical protein